MFVLNITAVSFLFCSLRLLSVCFPVTPQDYQPPGFKEADSNTIIFEREPVKLNMGEVVTPFHTLRLDMATERQRLEQVNERKRALINMLELITSMYLPFVCLPTRFTAVSSSASRFLIDSCACCEMSAGGGERSHDGEVGSAYGGGRPVTGQHTNICLHRAGSWKSRKICSTSICLR